MVFSWRRAAPTAGLFAIAAILLCSCSKENSYEPPPPPKIDVALPVKQTVTPYLEATGSAAAVNTTPLVARVAGFIQEIDYKDGDEVKAGTRLFLIEQDTYQLALEQAQAGQGSADASAKQSGADLKRQQELLSQKIISQSTLDQSAAAADVDAAKQKQSAVDVQQAQLNLSYTEVKAPFSGIVGARQVSIGQLVGAGSATTLATLVQLAPIYVNFNISEQDVLRIRAAMAKRGITGKDLKKIPVEVGLQNETGYPHKGMLDYASPEVTATTGTLAVRAVLPNDDRALLPGYFVRVRVPLGEEPDALLVPDRAIGSDQRGRYLLVAGKDDVVEERPVEIGQLVGVLRVISKGITAEDRVLVSGLLTAVPGQKIEPQVKTLDAATAGGAAQ
ncbi:efflux RND transporter periplasmic adaptor subunit [Mesorhizobium sp. CU2]|uniref:efflux RND transporter periplasmic adaptor subunit n=1 Tax=unclassified Mesorhizobium TaxID=325217 RepID=UPI00112DA393|nr:MULTISPECIES: efflux RND transporter periplasmic adaptor subunit [unclassified Mesorhizobium]TPN80436.1 efflux RND transporter periplasmic adaptor subunit [Mesorhizobium sp. CU3]TPO10566.1 efflux RND transporter periplasmic adaptor subunit [Mesorhizobium sp. CU2]